MSKKISQNVRQQFVSPSYPNLTRPKTKTEFSKQRHPMGMSKRKERHRSIHCRCVIMLMQRHRCILHGTTRPVQACRGILHGGAGETTLTLLRHLFGQAGELLEYHLFRCTGTCRGWTKHLQMSIYLY